MIDFVKNRVSRRFMFGTFFDILLRVHTIYIIYTYLSDPTPFTRDDITNTWDI